MRSLKDKHIEDMQAQMSAHKSTVESLRDQADKQLQSELRSQKEQFNKDQGLSM